MAKQETNEDPKPATRVKNVDAKDRMLLLGLLALFVAVFALVGSNVEANHAPYPHGVPIGVIGTPPIVGMVTGSLAHASPGAYHVYRYTSVAAARTAILDRSVYGAYRPVGSPLLVVANAASLSVANLLQQTFTAAARQQGRGLAVQDLVPLPGPDPSGAADFSMLLSLIVAGVLGSALIYLLGKHRSAPQRLVATAALGIGAGFVASLVTTVVIGVFPGHFLVVWGVATLFVLALGVPIAAFQALLGLAGTAVGAIMFLVIGSPAAGSAAPELLPSFWRQLSQALPPGAAATVMRDVVYFHGHRITREMLVLWAYVILGTAAVFTIHNLRSRTRPAG